jgi:hypothetical protein
MRAALAARPSYGITRIYSTFLRTEHNRRYNIAANTMAESRS